MNFDNQSEFGKAGRKHAVITDPKTIREAFERDQQAEDDAKFDVRGSEVFRHPDGEFFEVAYVRENGYRVTTTGRWVSPAEWLECLVVPVSQQAGA